MDQQLKALIGDDEKAKAVLDLVNKHNPMKKYLQTDKGKAAKKRANQKYYDKHGKICKADKGDVEMQLTDWCWNVIELETRGLTDREVLDPAKFNPIRYMTLTELWHNYGETAGFPHCTRKVYETLLPELKKVNKFTRDGKKYYQPAYEVDLIKVTNFKIEDE